MNREIKMKKLSYILLAVSLLTLSGVASAVPIVGTIKFGGDLTFDLNANTVDIIGNDAIVIAAPGGDFASYVSLGDTAVYNDFTYSPFTTVSPLWSVGGFSFTLSQIVSVFETTAPSGQQFLSLTGNGTFSGNGFDDTYGNWTFSADGQNGQFAFSSVSVPEPGTALLLGVGLIGFGAARKLRKTA